MVHPERQANFLAALTDQLNRLGATTVLSADPQSALGLDIELPIRGLAPIVDAIILLRYVEYGSQLRRWISILKMHETLFDPSIREFRVGAEGIEIGDVFDSTEAILSGMARAVRHTG